MISFIFLFLFQIRKQINFFSEIKPKIQKSRTMTTEQKKIFSLKIDKKYCKVCNLIVKKNFNYKVYQMEEIVIGI
jgi:hypothetical protein